jgi:dissimilatory sulfite reductase (desulfoviridin) alpha/beta subunit
LSKSLYFSIETEGFFMPNEMINKAIDICRKHGVTGLINFTNQLNKKQDFSYG